MQIVTRCWAVRRDAARSINQPAGVGNIITGHVRYGGVEAHIGVRDVAACSELVVALGDVLVDGPD